MTTVYGLYHSHEWDDGHDEVKLIGIFSTRAKAEAALAKVKDQPGFCDSPEGFSIDDHEIDPEILGWAEGFITALPDGSFSS